MIADGAGVLAHVVRGELVESVHHGHLVVLDADGSAVVDVGDPGVTFLPRSSLKPVQAVAMVRAGLDLDGELLALTTASHSGEPGHLDGVRRILAEAGLTEADLQNTPHPALGRRGRVRVARCRPQALGADAELLGQARRDARHLRRRRMGPSHLPRRRPPPAAGDPGRGRRPHRRRRSRARHRRRVRCAAVLVHGGRAGAVVRPDRHRARGTPEHRVAAAIRRHPWFLGGTGRDVTRFIEGVPGLVAKDGADGVFAAALPDGRALALKVLDGAARPVPVVVAAVLRAVGVDAAVLDEIGRVDVLGHGVPVGAVRGVNNLR